jgi:hypothetical protein
MSRSRKDGRKKGAHKNTQGKEMYAARPCSYSCCPCKYTKTRCHKIERQDAKTEVSAEVEDIASMGPRNTI